MPSRFASALWRAQTHVPASVRRLVRSLPGTRRMRDRILGPPQGRALEPGDLRPVVYLPTWLEWDTMRQRPQYVLEELARAGHQVWFVDPRLPAPTTRGNVHLVPDLRSIPAEGVIAYVHFPVVRHLLERFRDPIVIYDVLDDLSIYDSGEGGLPDRERAAHHHERLLVEAQVVVTSHPLLLEDLAPVRPDVLLIENGVDPSRFAPNGPVAHDLPSGTIVGYHGAIAPWFDFELVSRVATALPALEFVLVGPVEVEVRERLARLVGKGNVTWLGPRSADDVPAYVRGFDVGIIPFVVDEMTSRVSPLKLYEYLSSGVPVIATPLPAAVDHPRVATASTMDEFARLIESTLVADRDVDALVGSAGEASWNRRLTPLLTRLDEAGLRRVR